MSNHIPAAPWAIQAITLLVVDLEEAKDFYLKAFGLPVHYEDSDSVVFDFGGILINLLTESAAPELCDPATIAPREAGSRMVITAPVQDVDAVAARLQEVGIELLNGPIDRPWGPRTASFVDPNGYIWEISQ